MFHSQHPSHGLCLPRAECPFLFSFRVTHPSKIISGRFARSTCRSSRKRWPTAPPAVGCPVIGGPRPRMVDPPGLWPNPHPDAFPSAAPRSACGLGRACRHHPASPPSCGAFPIAGLSIRGCGLTRTRMHFPRQRLVKPIGRACRHHPASPPSRWLRLFACLPAPGWVSVCLMLALLSLFRGLTPPPTLRSTSG